MSRWMDYTVELRHNYDKIFLILRRKLLTKPKVLSQLVIYGPVFTKL
jgi:hypothetical protein